MKKLFVYRTQKPTWWTEFKIHIYIALGYKVFIWGDSNLSGKHLNPIKFPSASHCSEYQDDARMLSANFFKKYRKKWSEDIYKTDYIRKTIDISVTDYYAFEKTILKLYSPKDKVKKIAPPLLNSIFQDKPSYLNLWIVLYYPFWLIRLTIVLLKDILLSLGVKNKVQVPSIIYIRKKVYPDMGEYNHLSKALNTDNCQKILGVYPFAGRTKHKYGFYFISSIEGISLNLLRSYVGTVLHSFGALIFFLKNGVDHNFFRAYLFDTLKAKSIINLNPLIICGQLLDKPLYVLLSKYKKKSTMVVSINESFRFPPNRSFDFNHLDRYYSMNKIDEGMQNKYGGNIKTFKQVEFFRRGKATELTKDLSDAIKLHKFSIVLATGQIFVEKSGFNFWSYNELENFLRVSLGLSKVFKDVLFIVKGKKGELDMMPKWFDSMVESSNNIYVVNCIKPRYLKYNNFEALMDEVDLLVSSAYISTTVWQAITRNKPAIGVNDIHPPSILRDFKGYECNLSELHETILYWMSQSEEEIYKSTEEMKVRFNIGSNNGLNQIATDLQNLSHFIETN